MFKKIMLLILFAASTQSLAFSFDKIAVYGGGNLAPIIGDLETDGNLGLRIGTKGTKNLSKGSYVSIGLEFSTKNSDKSGNFLGKTNAKIESESLWVQIPILYNHKFDKFFGYGGAYISYLLDESFDEYENGNKGTVTGESDIFEDIDYGIRIGGGYKITDSGSLTLDYSLGLAETVEVGDSQLSSLSFGYSHTL